MKILMNIIIALLSINAHADIQFGEPDCNNVFKNGGVAEMYFLTKNPKEMFYKMYQMGTDAYESDDFEEWVHNNLNPRRGMQWNNFQKENQEILAIDKDFTFCRAQIYIYSNITGNDLVELQKHIEEFKNPPFLIVNILSSGGLIESAMEIGRLIRQHYGHVTVGAPYWAENISNASEGCFSACVLIYASGVSKNIKLADVPIGHPRRGDWWPIGIHQSYLPDNAIQKMSVDEGIATIRNSRKKIKAYYDELDIPDDFTSLTMSKGKNSMFILSDRQLTHYLPFAVAEYAAIYPVKEKQIRNEANKIFAEVFYNELTEENKSITNIIEKTKIRLKIEKDILKWYQAPYWHMNTGIYWQKKY